MTKQFQMRRLFQYQPIRNQNGPWRPCLLKYQVELKKFNKWPLIDASCQISVHLAIQFHKRIFLNQPIRDQNSLWRPCQLTAQDEMRKFFRGPVIDASCQISVHLSQQCQRKRYFQYRPIKNKNFPWQPCLLTEQDKMRKLYKGPYIDASYQVLFHLAMHFRREDFFSIPANQKQELLVAAIFADGSGQNERTL